jgi:hypothetical protein
MRTSRSLHLPAFLLAASCVAAGVVGCGSSSSTTGSGATAPASGRAFSPASRLVDANRPPFVTGLAVSPRDQSILLATNKGLFRIPAGGGKAAALPATVKVGAATGAFGGQVSSLAFDASGALLGSGHPDRPGNGMPGFLGLIRSGDGGKTWDTVSRSGLSDLHVLVVGGPGIVAYDTTLGGTIVSKDDGKNWTELSTPPALVLDLAIDPKDPKHLLAGTNDSLFASTDDGANWKKIGKADAARLSWTERHGLLRAVRGGQVSSSTDGGATWKPVGNVPGNPGKLVEAADGTLYLALEDGTIFTSSDGGTTWRSVSTP